MEQKRKEDPNLKAAEVRSLLEFLQEVPSAVEGEHLSEDDLASYGDERGEADIERIDRHLAACETCTIRMERRLTIPKHLAAAQSEGEVKVHLKAASVGYNPAAFLQSGSVALAAGGVNVPFEAFLAGLEPRLKRLLATYRIPSEDAEDLLQQALLALLYQWGRIRDPESWLFGSVKRSCLMYWRAHRRRVYSAVDASILEWLAEPSAPSQEHSDLLAELERLIARLPSRCQSLLRLRFRLGYAPPEVAEKLGYRTSSIGKITSRCLTALSRELLASGLARRFTEARRAR